MDGKETMDMNFLGVLLNLDGIILIRILEETENFLKVLDFLGFIPGTNVHSVGAQGF